MVQIFGASPRRILRRKETWSNWPNGAEESPKHVLNHAKSKKWHDFCFGSRSLGHRDPLKSFFTSWSCHSYCQVISKSGNLNLIYHWLPLVVPILRPWHDCCSSTQPRKAQCQGRSLKHSPSNKALVWFPTNTWCVANRDCNGSKHRLSGRVVRVTIPGDILPVASHKPSRSPSQTTHC